MGVPNEFLALWAAAHGVLFALVIARRVFARLVGE